MNVVAVVPARGGSKGISGKNLRHVGGIALVVRAVRTALASPLIDRVIVTTDDPAIASVARRAGAEIVDRPAALANDQASSEAALLHCLDVLEEPVDVVVFIQATSPFIDASALEEAIERVSNGTYDVALSAVETHEFLWTEAGDGVNHDRAVRLRRQDRSPHFRETGAFYVMDAAGFIESRHRFFGRIGMAVVDPRTAIEIDNFHELELANAIAPLFESAVDIDADAVITDFVGVHTDDTVSVDSHGNESVVTSRSDGMGVRLLREAGIPVLILSTESNSVVSARARKLQVEVQQGVTDKAAALVEWAERQFIPLERIAYLGNDINDLNCLRLVGWPVAVPGSAPEVLSAARLILTRPGGHGAVRELADHILRSTRLSNITEPRHHTESETPWSYPSEVTQ